jgi:hypothetical protein
MTIKNSGGRPTLRPGKTMFRTAGAQGMVGDVPFYHTVIPGFRTFIAPQKCKNDSIRPTIPVCFQEGFNTTSSRQAGVLLLVWRRIFGMVVF